MTLATIDEFVCVAHAGAIEAKAALLCASIRHLLGEEANVTVAVPEPQLHWGAPSAQAYALFERLGATVIPISNPISLEYPYGNKIGALASIDKPVAFLDSDMMLVRPLRTHWALQCVDAALKYADIDTFQRGGGNWRRVYSLFGCDLPDYRVRATDTQEIMFPYYNAGFIWVRNGSQFTEVWSDTARQIEDCVSITNKRPWLDQIALPVALTRLGWSVSAVPDALNFPGHIRGGAEHNPYILHYHDAANILNFASATRVLRECLAAFAELEPVLSQNGEWSALLSQLEEAQIPA